ncbi:MAG: tetratricopeptide repeat protein, partial [Cyclobacteriaceae bacterium]|nr:tetratricopeptide repeat protein [Cyclobacteriaceae bacterium]
MKKYICFSFLFLSLQAAAQKIPTALNKTDVNGLKQGKWVISFDKEWNVTDEPQQVYYYRLITYKNGKPSGKVKDYYARNGKLQFEGAMLDDTPKNEIATGRCIWYYESGKVSQKAWFDEVGNLMKVIAYDEKGKPLPQNPTPASEDGEQSNTESEWVKLNQQGLELYEEGRYNEAIQVFEKALQQAEKEFGREHPDYATSCNNLALLYAEQGRYNEAELLYKEAKEIRIKVLGKEHPDYATSCNNLALLYAEQGRYN